jgi:hypothetical protein
VFDALVEKLRSDRLEPSQLQLDEEKDEFVIEEWRDLESFLRESDDEIVLALLNLLEEDDDEIPDGFETVPVARIMDVIDRMETPVYEALMRELGLKAVPHNSPDYPRASRMAAELLPKSAFFEEFLEAYSEVALKTEEFKQTLKNRISEYIAVGYPLQCYFAHVVIDEDNFDTPVQLRIRVSDLVEIAASDDDDYDDDYNGARLYAMQDGWAMVDWEYLREQRREAGMTTEKDIDSDPVIANLLKVGEGDDEGHIRVDNWQVAKAFAKRLGW